MFALLFETEEWVKAIFWKISILHRKSCHNDAVKVSSEDVIEAEFILHTPAALASEKSLCHPLEIW
jgi:hypothetical protein